MYDLFKRFKGIYFPDGISPSKGFLSQMDAAVYGQDYFLIENLDQAVEDNVTFKALKNFKLIFRL